MNKRYLASVAALASALTLNVAIAADSAATTPQFSADQKQQIQEVVHSYLVNNPQVLIEVSQKLQAQQEKQMQQVEENAQKAIPEVAATMFNSASSPVAGNPKGDVTVVEFFDYQCPHCKDADPTLKEMIQKDPNLRIVYKEFPIFGNSSAFASKAALAANMQGKYAAFHDALMATPNPLTTEKVMAAAQQAGLNVDQLKKDMDSDAVKEELANNLKLAQKLGIMGTPAFVIGSTANAASKDSKSFFIPGVAGSDIVLELVAQVRGSKAPSQS